MTNFPHQDKLVVPSHRTGVGTGASNSVLVPDAFGPIAEWINKHIRSAHGALGGWPLYDYIVDEDWAGTGLPEATVLNQWTGTKICSTFQLALTDAIANHWDDYVGFFICRGDAAHTVTDWRGGASHWYVEAAGSGQVVIAFSKNSCATSAPLGVFRNCEVSGWVPTSATFISCSLEHLYTGDREAAHGVLTLIDSGGDDLTVGSGGTDHYGPIYQVVLRNSALAVNCHIIQGVDAADCGASLGGGTPTAAVSVNVAHCSYDIVLDHCCLNAQPAITIEHTSGGEGYGQLWLKGCYLNWSAHGGDPVALISLCESGGTVQGLTLEGNRTNAATSTDYFVLNGGTISRAVAVDNYWGALAEPLSGGTWSDLYIADNTPVGVTYPSGVTSGTDAGQITYTPTDLTDWDSDADPGNVDDALDQLAARSDDLEATSHARLHSLGSTDDHSHLADYTVGLALAYASFGDADCGVIVASNAAAWVFDAVADPPTADYIVYDRDADVWDFYIASVGVFQIGATGAKVDAIDELTADAGVTVDGVTLKDDAVETDAIRGLRETSGPTALTLGDIADGEYLKRDGATVVGAAGGGGDVATDAIWDAAGDLAVGSGANTAVKLAKGDEGEVLSIVAGAVAWAASTGGGGVMDKAFLF